MLDKAHTSNLILTSVDQTSPEPRTHLLPIEAEEDEKPRPLYKRDKRRKQSKLLKTLQDFLAKAADQSLALEDLVKDFNAKGDYEIDLALVCDILSLRLCLRKIFKSDNLYEVY